MISFLYIILYILLVGKHQLTRLSQKFLLNFTIIFERELNKLGFLSFPLLWNIADILAIWKLNRTLT